MFFGVVEVAFSFALTKFLVYQHLFDRTLLINRDFLICLELPLKIAHNVNN